MADGNNGKNHQDENHENENHQDQAPAERAIDLLVYAPVGLALYVRDMLPSMMGVFINRGKREVGSRRAPNGTSGPLPAAPEMRRRVEDGIGIARGVAEGGIGVARGVAEGGIGLARGLAGPPANFARDCAGNVLHGLLSWRTGESASWPAEPPSARVADSEPASTAPASTSLASAPSASTSSTAVSASAALPIPDYDELSASQVVERLDGLDRESLEAIRRYESEHRGRNTILGKITKLT